MVEIFEKNLSPQQQSMVRWVTLYHSYIFSSAIKPVNSAIIHPTHSLSPSHNSALMPCIKLSTIGLQPRVTASALGTVKVLRHFVLIRVYIGHDYLFSCLDIIILQ